MKGNDIMGNNLLVAYKFGERFNGELSPKGGINLYNLHAQSHDGKVLFTVNKPPRPAYQDKIKKIILMTKDGNFAILADVDGLGRFSTVSYYPIPDGYTVPSIWENEDTEKLGWYALSNLKTISIKRGMFKSVNDRDLLDSMSGNAYMTYVSLDENGNCV